MPYCSVCGDGFDPRRAALGYTTCIKHGEPRRQFCSVPVPKSNYIIATSVEQLRSPYDKKGFML